MTAYFIGLPEALRSRQFWGSWKPDTALMHPSIQQAIWQVTWNIDDKEQAELNAFLLDLERKEHICLITPTSDLAIDAFVNVGAMFQYEGETSFRAFIRVLQ